MTKLPTPPPASLTEQVLIAASTYATAAGVELAVLSRRVLGDSKSLPALAAGTASITLRRAELLLEWLAENWPEGAEWPEGVARPASPAQSPAAAL